MGGPLAPQISANSGDRRCPRSLAADPEAARGLMAFRPFVIGVLRECRVPDKDVPDIAQEVLTQLLPWWTGRGTTEPETPVDSGRTYVYVATVRTACRHRRKEARHGEVLGWEPELGEEGGALEQGAAKCARSPEELWLDLEAATARAEMTDLDWLGNTTEPARWRAFYAHAVIGASVAQIAEAEQVAVPTIYHRISLARQDMRAAILRRCATRRCPRSPLR